MLNCEFSIATNSDCIQLKNINLPYSYINHIEHEINHPNDFRWLISKNNKDQIISFHRCCIIADWGFLSGIYISKYNESNGTLLTTLIKAIDDLETVVSSGLLAWDDYPATRKTTILKKLGFQVYEYPIFRLLFDKKSIDCMQTVNSKEDGFWKIADEKDYKEIYKLLDYQSSFIQRLPYEFKKIRSNWFINIKDNKVVCAINWTIVKDTLEVHFTLSKESNFDIFMGLSLLISNVKKHNVKSFKLNLEHTRLVTFLKLLKFSPKTYNKGFKNTCLLKKIES